jgi:hypothetical protein
MRGIQVLGGIVAVAVGLASGGGDASARGGHGVRPPASLMVSVARGPASALDGARDYANALQPGAGMMLTDDLIDRMVAPLVGARSLDGLDRASPSYLLVVDAGPKVRGVALLGRVADPRALAAGAGTAFVRRDKGWAVIGPRAVVQQIAPYALHTLSREPAPAQPTATVYVQHALARYDAQIQQGLVKIRSSMPAQSGAMAAMMKMYVDGLQAVVHDTDQLIVTVDADRDDAMLDVALVPRRGSPLARFVAAQRPSDFRILSKLPDGPAMVVFAGHFDSGPYHDGLMHFMAQIYGQGMPPDIIQAMGAVMKAASGDIAMSMNMAPGAGMTMTELWGVTDERATDKGIRYALGRIGAGRTFDVMGIKSTLKAMPGTTTHDGVTLRGYEASYDLSHVTAAQRAGLTAVIPAGGMQSLIGVFGGLGVVAMAPDSAAAAAAAIDAARGKGAHYAPSRELGRLLAASRARKESFVMVMDMVAFARMGGTLPVPAKAGPHVMVWSMGFADHAAHLRLSLPAATTRALMGRP